MVQWVHGGENRVLRTDVVVDDACASTLPVAFGGPAELAEAATGGNPITCVRSNREQKFQLEEVGLRKNPDFEDASYATVAATRIHDTARNVSLTR